MTAEEFLQCPDVLEARFDVRQDITALVQCVTQTVPRIHIRKRNSPKNYVFVPPECLHSKQKNLLTLWIHRSSIHVHIGPDFDERSFSVSDNISILDKRLAERHQHLLSAAASHVEHNSPGQKSSPRTTPAIPHGPGDASGVSTPRTDSASISDTIDMDMSGDGKEGYVYILTNAAMNSDYLKIGMTTRTSEQRAIEISRGTGVVCPFQVAYEEHVSDCQAIERTLHRMLSDHRIQTNREFFHLPLKEAIKIVQQVANASGQDSSDQPLR